MSFNPVRIVPLDFDSLAPYKEEIKLDGKIYILSEASADIGTRYRDGLASKIRMKDGKPSGIDGFADLEFPLVSGCLTLDGVSVQVDQLRKWPYRVIKTIADRIKEVSGLDEGKEPVKNELSAG